MDWPRWWADEGRQGEGTCGAQLTPPPARRGHAGAPGRPSQGGAPPASQVSDKFAFGLFDLDWEVFAQHIEGAVNRVPVLEKTGVKSTVCGPGEWGAWELGLDIRGPSG